ncbi:flippase [Flavobacterium silvaticum]|uniref:Flippase n=1 Tax=Flavobacterium silvaticum TaxID=1852020 RepID=A0A972G0V6_9FLAO|nr:flippase [Flavobacterium silvaticum]NMH28386.1 flippase [Flavobacterium silvaticum]
MLKKILNDIDLINFILKKGGLIFLFRMISMALTFFTTWYISTHYGGSDFGRFSLALTVLQIIFLFFALGLPSVFLAFTGSFTNDELKKGLLIKATKIVLVVSVFPVLVTFFGADLIAQGIFEKESLAVYFRIVAFAVPFMILHEIICYYFISVSRHLSYGILLFVLPNIVFTLFLILTHCFDLPGYFTFLDYTLGIAITVLVGFFMAFYQSREFSLPDLSYKDILRKSIPMMVGSMFLLLLNWTDILMLGRMETEENIGIYNAAFKIGYLALFFIASMNVVVMPKISELFHQDNIPEMKKVINRATQIVIVLTLPLALFIMIFSKEILSIYGEDFVAGSTCLIFITAGALFNAMTGNVDQILNMTNQQNLVKNIFFIGFVLNVVLNLFLISAYGIQGAALSSLITNVIVNVIFVYKIKKNLGFYTFI